MPKKHRVKRAKYVEHLLKLEKERDAYLERRLKRQRKDRDEEDPMSRARDAIEAAARAKKRRTERHVGDEEEGGNSEADEAPVVKQEKEARAMIKSDAAVDRKAGFFQVSSGTSAPLSVSTSKSDGKTDTSPAAPAKRATKKRY